MSKIEEEKGGFEWDKTCCLKALIDCQYKNKGLKRKKNLWL
jgi:hypothetical protein